jgi:hypothetical protein
MKHKREMAVLALVDIEKPKIALATPGEVRAIEGNGGGQP